jgi:hypothetical protein
MILKNAKIQSFRPTKDGGVVFSLKFLHSDIAEDQAQTVRALWTADQEVDININPSIATGALSPSDAF